MEKSPTKTDKPIETEVFIIKRQKKKPQSSKYQLTLVIIMVLCFNLSYIELYKTHNENAMNTKQKTQTT